jgi:Leucine-rich repeat (LRR) protein
MTKILDPAIQDYLNGICCPEPVVTFNFDVTANWATGDATFPVTDQASFEAFLANRSNNDTNDLTSIVITDFNLQGNRLQCNLTANGTILDISEMVVTEFLSIGNITSLQHLVLISNQIVTFNPTLALPTSLQYLRLDNNQITTFNPTLPLPTSLQNLYLSGNQIIEFNPTIVLPSSLVFLGLGDNQMTTAGYTTSESWANGIHTAPSGGIIGFVGNIDPASGTNLETILTNKGWIVNA